MTDERRQEMETIAELAVTKVDLKYTEELGALRAEMKDWIQSEIKACQRKNDGRWRFNITTLIAVLGLLVASWKVWVG